MSSGVGGGRGSKKLANNHGGNRRNSGRRTTANSHGAPGSYSLVNFGFCSVSAAANLPLVNPAPALPTSNAVNSLGSGSGVAEDANSLARSHWRNCSLVVIDNYNAADLQSGYKGWRHDGALQYGQQADNDDDDRAHAASKRHRKRRSGVIKEQMDSMDSTYQSLAGERVKGGELWMHERVLLLSRRGVDMCLAWKHFAKLSVFTWRPDLLLPDWMPPCGSCNMSDKMPFFAVTFGPCVGQSSCVTRVTRLVSKRWLSRKAANGSMS